MKKPLRKISTRNSLSFLCVFLLSCGLIKAPQEFMSFTVSMEDPASHYYHVVFRYEGVKDEELDFKMPAWTPGYYRILDFAKNVVRFKAQDGLGNELAWEKTSKNTWRVKTGKSKSVAVSYDVYAFEKSVADSYLDESYAYISPTSIFMHVSGKIARPVKIRVKPHHSFSQISTGLESVEGEPDTFFAPDFDTLYDCPIFIGNQQVFYFDVMGILHRVVVNEREEFDQEKMASFLKKIVESAAALMGEIPYCHYTFIMMGEGQGGLNIRIRWLFSPESLILKIQRPINAGCVLWLMNFFISIM